MIPISQVIMGFSFPVVLLFAFERLCDWRNQPKAAILVVQLSAGFLAQLFPWDKTGHTITSFLHWTDQA